ncbi:MAG TPA: hypothetical protein VL996_11390 [Methylocella sp.]|nr:hypothetical protein [Methylocella sp.]
MRSRSARRDSLGVGDALYCKSEVPVEVAVQEGCPQANPMTGRVTLSPNSTLMGKL